MPEIDVVAVLIAKAGSEGVVGSALHDLLAPTRAEPGCISYHLFTSASSAQTFVTIEKWRSEDDIAAHMQSAHIAAALAAAGEHLAAPPAIHSLIPDAG